MADLSTVNSAQPIVIIGSDSTGLETTPVGSTAAGELLVQPRPYYPKTFVAQVSTVALGNNKSMFAIMNSSASAIVKIQYIKTVNNQTTAVTGVAADFRTRRITGSTGGTEITPSTFDTADTLTAGISVATGATVSGESASDLIRWVYSSDEWGPGTNDVESDHHAHQQLHPVWKKPSEGKAIYLRPGQGLTIKCVTNTTAGSFDYEVCFTEE